MVPDCFKKNNNTSYKMEAMKNLQIKTFILQEEADLKISSTTKNLISSKYSWNSCGTLGKDKYRFENYPS